MVYPSDKQIRELAYRLWLEAGKPEGGEKEWHQAERQLQTQAEANSPEATG